MSKYTTELKYIVEFLVPDITDRYTQVSTAAPLIFDFPFPIWLDEYKQILEEKIIWHYYLREIAFETYGLWKLWLRKTLNEQMPYFNELYKTVARDYDYMNDTYINESVTRNRTDLSENNFNESGKSNTSAKGNNTTTNNLKSLFSNLPQSTESQQLGSDYYASEITKNTGTVNDENTNNTQGETSRNGGGNNKVQIGEQIITARWGNQGGKSQTQLLMEFRDSLINIDMLVIDSLKDLFFNLY